MRALVLLASGLALGLTACARSTLDVCEKAAIHAIDCGARDAFPWNNNNRCVEPDLCLATCIDKAPCAALTGGDEAALAALTACLDACPGGSNL